MLVHARDDINKKLMLRRENRFRSLVKWNQYQKHLMVFALNSNLRLIIITLTI